MTRRVVMFSGGLLSWATGKRVAASEGANNLTLLFADTLVESAGLYRFLPEAARDIGGELIRIADGRTPWRVFRDEGMIGNTRADICSRILKRDLSDRWLKNNCDPADTIVYLGIDWTEAHRFDDGKGRGAKHRYASNGWRCEAPMIAPPYLDKADHKRVARAAGLPVSEAYEEGWPHDNCNGGCVKAGQKQFAMLLERRPAVFGQWESEEQAFRVETGKDVAILRDRRGGKTRPLTLSSLRERIQAGAQIDQFDIGGCGCFVG